MTSRTSMVEVPVPHPGELTGGARVTGWAFRTSIVAASALALLSACAAVGPNYTAPVAPVSRHYDQKAESQLAPTGATPGVQHIALGEKVSGDWWTVFHSPKLDELMHRAIAGNLDLVAADATIAQASEAVVAARGGLYPQVDYGAVAGRQRSAGSPEPAASSFYAVGPQVSFDLDVFGGTKRLVEQRVALADFQKRRFDAAYLTLTGDVARQALLLASARAQIDAVETLLANDKKNLELVRMAHLNGSVTQVEVALAETQLSQDETLLPPLAQQRDTARHALSILAGKGPADWAAPDFDLADFTLPSNLPVSLPAELAHDRPDILEAEAELHAASAAIGVATANLYPHLTISAAAAIPGSLVTAGGTLWSAAAGLTGPLFHGGTLQAERRGAVDNYKASLARYQQTVIQSLGQVADVMQSINHDAEESSAQEHAMNAAAASLRLNRAGFRGGEVGVLEVLDAERAYQRALLGQIGVRTAQYLDTAELSVALGGNSIGTLDLTRTIRTANKG
jgi:NodT family efflux transporter outer membrane factor (OMF) lipoprotein